MNKLVSINPVQRFKQGRKIIKAKNSWGGNFGVYTFTPTNEQNIRERTNKAAEEAVKNTKEITPAEQGRYNRTHPVGSFNNEEGFTGVVSPNYYYRSDRNDILGRSFEDTFPYIYDADTGNLKGQSILVLSDAQQRKTYSDIVNQMPKVAIENIINNSNNASNNTGSPVINTAGTKDAVNNNQVTQKNSGRTSRRTSKRSTIQPSPKFYGQTIGGKVLARGSNFNGLISDSQKQALLNAGFKNEDFNDVRSFQNALNNFFSKDYGAGSIKVDNMWGNQTQRAFDLALSKAVGLQSLKSPEIVKKPELPTISKNEPSIINYKIRNGNYNRSQIRDLIRSGGFNPYTYTGAQRKALRLYLNGLSNDTSLLDGTDLARFTLPFRKKGGQLISRNPVKRFKQRNFRSVVQ